jgi:polyhydroxyalkanoate synthesis repressor PhaR
MPHPIVPAYSPTGSEASSPAPAPQQPPVVVKKYANRRLYNTETSSYITLDNLADMIRAGRDFVVYDAKSGEDITRGVLTQIIVEEESKGTSMLPTAFLRQLIGFYGGSLQGVVPRYLEQAMSTFARQQQQLRQVVQQTFSPFLPAGVEEMSRQNVAMIERAMSMFNPFHRGSEPLPPTGGPQAAAEAVSHPAGPRVDLQEVERLHREIEDLHAQLASARAEAVVAHAPAAPEGAPVAEPVTEPTADSYAGPQPVAAAPLRTSRRARVASVKDVPV